PPGRGTIAAGKGLHQHPRRDLPGHAPLVLAPAARAFLAAVADDRVPVAVRLRLVLDTHLERERLAVLERRSAIEADAGDAQDREVHRQHRAFGTRRVVGRRPRHGPDGRIREGLRVEPGGLLGVAVVPETDRVLRWLGHDRLLASRVGAGYGRIGSGHKYRGVGGHWG